MFLVVGEQVGGGGRRGRRRRQGQVGEFGGEDGGYQFDLGRGFGGGDWLGEGRGRGEGSIII